MDERSRQAVAERTVTSAWTPVAGATVGARLGHGGRRNGGGHNAARRARGGGLGAARRGRGAGFAARHTTRARCGGGAARHDAGAVQGSRSDTRRGRDAVGVRCGAARWGQCRGMGQSRLVRDLSSRKKVSDFLSHA